MEFVASIVSSLAWPIVIGVLLAVFGRPLKEWLLDRPSKVSVGPFKAEWATQAAKAESSIEAAVQEPIPATHGQGTQQFALLDELERLVDINPGAAVVAGARELEVVLRDKLKAQGTILVRNAGLLTTARVAQDKQLIDVHIALALEGLANLRNLAAHGGNEVTSEQAREFLRIAAIVLEALRPTER